MKAVVYIVRPSFKVDYTQFNELMINNDCKKCASSIVLLLELFGVCFVERSTIG